MISRTARGALALSASLGLLLAGEASAVPTYTIQAQSQTPITGNEAVRFDGDSINIVAALAGLGAAVQSTSSIGLNVAKTTFIYEDFIISGAGDFVTASINLELEGSLGVDGPFAGAYVRVDGGWFSGLVNLCVTDLPNNAGCGGPTIPNYLTEGILSSVTGTTELTTLDAVYASPSRLFPVNTPFSIGLTLEVGANAISSGSLAFADFFHTLTFPTSGPVFNLPSGYTLNSLEASIVDNRWITDTDPDPDPEPDPVPVPEPSSLLLLCAGLALGATFRRRLAAR